MKTILPAAVLVSTSSVRLTNSIPSDWNVSRAHIKRYGAGDPIELPYHDDIEPSLVCIRYQPVQLWPGVPGPADTLLHVFAGEGRQAHELDGRVLPNSREQWPDFKLDIIQREAGCAIGVIHRFAKASEGNLTQRIRGAGAIAGWAERAIGIEKVPLDRGTRRMEFELKPGDPPDPIFHELKSHDLQTYQLIERVGRAAGEDKWSSPLDEFIQ